MKEHKIIYKGKEMTCEEWRNILKSPLENEFNCSICEIAKPMKTPDDGLETRGLETNEEALAIVQQIKKKIEDANTPDTEWTDAVEDIVRKIETLETDYSDGSYVSTSDAKKIGNDIQNLLTSRDTYWKERVGKEVERIEGTPLPDSYSESPDVISKKEVMEIISALFK